CLPVLFCDDAGTVVAAAHAGWRGLAAGVLEATVAALAAKPASVMAWMGAAIGPQSFEVGAEVRDAFLTGHPEAESLFEPRRCKGASVRVAAQHRNGFAVAVRRSACRFHFCRVEEAYPCPRTRPSSAVCPASRESPSRRTPAARRRCNSRSSTSR